MRHLHLPAEHDDADRELAAALAHVLDSGDLYVTWSSRAGRARPVAAAAPACETRKRRRGLAGLFSAFSRRRTA